jgi:hypothetical protein
VGPALLLGQWPIAPLLQLVGQLILRLEDTLREDFSSGGFSPDFLFVIPADNDLLHGVFPLYLTPYTLTAHLPLVMAPLLREPRVVEERDGMTRCWSGQSGYQKAELPGKRRCRRRTLVQHQEIQCSVLHECHRSSEST